MVKLAELSSQSLQVRSSPLHGDLNSTKELASPHDVACNRRRVPGQRRGMLVPLIQSLHLFQVLSIVLEDDQVLGLQIALQYIVASHCSCHTDRMAPAQD